jgi:2-dehydro-3-deoxyphosphogluconate aldolase/(4S)-4-hydroxy-2-oxoglutarate aldolase
MNTTRSQTVDALIRNGFLPVIFYRDQQALADVITVIQNSGCRVLQFGRADETAFALCSNLLTSKQLIQKGTFWGAGPVNDALIGEKWLRLGANFLSADIFNAELAMLCNRCHRVYLPGVYHQEDITLAEEWGSELLRWIPSVTGGKDKAEILARNPDSNLVKTCAVPPAQIEMQDWLSSGGALIEVPILVAGNVPLSELRLQQDLDDYRSWVNSARSISVFSGIEHIGIGPGENAEHTARWYGEVFNLEVHPGNSSIFIGGTGPGRIEISRTDKPTACHIAIEVDNFERAVADLTAKGISLEKPIISEQVKAIYLQTPDPSGNRVHLMWRKNK